MGSRSLSVSAWAFAGLAFLVLFFGWPFMIWRAVSSGLPIGPAVLDSMLWPVVAILLWAVARGLGLARRQNNLRPPEFARSGPWPAFKGRRPGSAGGVVGSLRRDSWIWRALRVGLWLFKQALARGRPSG